MKVLLVEDDPSIATFIKRGLEAENYLVHVAENGRDALTLAREISYPLLILDRILPYVDGLEVCRMLRREGANCLILMLTAKDALQDRVDGLRAGADDYLTKPFGFDELLARVQALLRRARYEESASLLQVGDLTLDATTRKVSRRGRDIQLTVKEFALLSYMMKHQGEIISRARLLSNVWGHSFDHGTKVANVYVHYLRNKVDKDEDQPLIHTVRGLGYKISDESPAGS